RGRCGRPFEGVSTGIVTASTAVVLPVEKRKVAVALPFFTARVRAECSCLANMGNWSAVSGFLPTIQVGESPLDLSSMEKNRPKLSGFALYSSHWSEVIITPSIFSGCPLTTSDHSLRANRPVYEAPP